MWYSKQVCTHTELYFCMYMCMHKCMGVHRCTCGSHRQGLLRQGLSLSSALTNCQASWLVSPRDPPASVPPSSCHTGLQMVWPSLGYWRAGLSPAASLAGILSTKWPLHSLNCVWITCHIGSDIERSSTQKFQNLKRRILRLGMLLQWSTLSSLLSLSQKLDGFRL